MQRTIRELAEFVCGNKAHGEVEAYEGYRESHSYQVPSFPRKNQDIRQLFLDAVPDREGDIMAFFDAGKEAKLNKREKTIQALKEFCEADHEDISEPYEYLLCELAAPHTYRSKPELAQPALSFLNELLEFEGTFLVVERGRPKLMSIASLTAGASFDVALNLSSVVGESNLLNILQEMWTELLLCRDAGAFSAAMILLGGLLEGVLRSAADKDPKFLQQAMAEKSPTSYSGDPTLAELIPAAEKLGIIAQDRKKNLDSVREIRNLVHPARRLKAGGFKPGLGSVNIGIQVLREIVQDLGGRQVT